MTLKRSITKKQTSTLSHYCTRDISYEEKVTSSFRLCQKYVFHYFTIYNLPCKHNIGLFTVRTTNM